MMQRCSNVFGWSVLASATLFGACATTESDPQGIAGSGGSAGNPGSAGSAGSAGSGGIAGGSGGSGGATATAFACDSRTVTAATVVSADIDEDVTWTGTIHLQGTVRVVAGATLTIAPGTRVIAGVDSRLELGWNANAATLLAAGTAEQPIVFCGETADAGFWDGLIVESNVTSNSTLHNVLIADAGGSEQALSIAAELSVQNVHVENSGADGVRAAQFGEGSVDLSVLGALGVAVALTDARAVSPLPLGGTFSGNADNFVQLEFTNIAVDASFHDAGIPYVQESAVRVTAGATVSFEAGVEYQFEADASLDVGWNANDALLEISGTAAAPVVFRGVAELPGYWGGLLIRDNVRTSSFIDHLVLRHGGGGAESALRVETALRLADVLLELNETGAWIGAQGLDGTSANLTITTTEAVPLTVQPDGLVTLPEGGAFTGNTTDQVAVEAGDYRVSGTVPNLGVPYRVLGNIRSLESSMTIAAGTRFVMTADSGIEFGWNANSATIIAEGTAAAPIRFTGVDEVAGFWTGLYVGSNVLSASKFNYVEVGHAASACLTVQNDVVITNSSFFDCSGYGILKDADILTDYVLTNTFTSMGTSSVGTP